jgi:hypothetical protein
MPTSKQSSRRRAPAPITIEVTPLNLPIAILGTSPISQALLVTALQGGVAAAARVILPRDVKLRPPSRTGSPRKPPAATAADVTPIGRGRARHG